MLASIGSPVPVVGFLAQDPAGAQGLWAGVMTRRFAGSDLVRSTRVIAEVGAGVVAVADPCGCDLQRARADSAGRERRGDAPSTMEGIRS